jgi:reactive intermediate/imine deaminase
LYLREPGSARSLPCSAAVRAGDYVFVSGQVAMDGDGKIIEGEIEEHTRQTLRNLERVLALAQCTLADVVKVTVWLQHADDVDRFDRVYREFFPGPKPARSTTLASLIADSRLQIEAIAFKQ